MPQGYAVPKLIRIEELASTNDYASGLQREEDQPNFCTVVCNYQTNGKGQKGNYWESEQGKNLIISMIWKPDNLDAGDQFIISRAVSLAVADFVGHFVSPCHIKWPNDIYVGTGKIAGILIENVLTRSNIDHSVIGVGININQTTFLPQTPNPVSLSTLTGQEYELEALLPHLLDSLISYLSKIGTSAAESLDNQYVSRLYRFHEPARYQTAENEFTGRIVGVDHFGQLMVEDESGIIQLFDFKEITFL